jgi:hypothetical protein
MMAAKNNMAWLLVGAGAAWAFWRITRPKAPLIPAGTPVPKGIEAIPDGWIEANLPPSVTESLADHVVQQLIASGRLPDNALLAYVDPQLERTTAYLGNGVYLVQPSVLGAHTPSPTPMDEMERAALESPQPNQTFVPGAGEVPWEDF